MLNVSSGAPFYKTITVSQLVSYNAALTTACSAVVYRLKPNKHKPWSQVELWWKLKNDIRKREERTGNWEIAQMKQDEEKNV